MGEWREPGAGDFLDMQREVSREGGVLPPGEALDEEETQKTVKVFCDRVTVQLGHNPRVETGQMGDIHSQWVDFDPDVTTEPFLDELKGLSAARVELHIASKGSVEDMAPRFGIAWTEMDGNETHVLIEGGVLTHVIRYDKTRTPIGKPQQQLTREQGMRILDIMKALKPQDSGPEMVG